VVRISSLDDAFSEVLKLELELEAQEKVNNCSKKLRKGGKGKAKTSDKIKCV